MRVKIVKNNLVITIPTKKLKQLLEPKIETNGTTQPTIEQPVEQPVEQVDTTTGEQVPETLSTDTLVSTPETTGDTQVQQ